MQEDIRIDKDNYFTVRTSDWDEKAFGYPVAEILELVYSKAETLDTMLRKCAAIGAKLCCMRHDSSDLKMKHDLIEKDFYIAESALEVKGSFVAMETKRAFDFIVAKESHYKGLVAIARDDFHYSRFHEDPFVSRESAVARYVNWADSCIGNPRCMVSVDDKGNVKGFFLYSVEGKEIDLLLAGVSSKFKGMGHFFFSSVMDYLKKEGRSVKATISAANVPVINTYSGLGFKFTKSLFDYHKLL